MEGKRYYKKQTLPLSGICGNILIKGVDDVLCFNKTEIPIKMFVEENCAEKGNKFVFASDGFEVRYREGELILKDRESRKGRPSEIIKKIRRIKSVGRGRMAVVVNCIIVPREVRLE